MIEPIMYIGIGFLVAGLLVIGVIPLVHARAVRLTMRRLEALTPLSMAEIRADKDQLRAEFAMSTRRLEMNVEQMKARTTSQAAEIGRKSEAIGRLKFELGEKTAAMLALEAKEKQLVDDLQNLETQLAGQAGALQEAEHALASAQAELAQATTNFHESSMSSDSHRVELVALRTQSELLHEQIESWEKEAKELWDRLTSKTNEAQSLGQQLAEERGRANQLSGRVGELERHLVAQSTDAEVLGRRVEELTAVLEEQGRSMTDRQYASEHLRSEAQTAQENETRLRAELADAENRHQLTTEALAFEKSLIEKELKQSHEERARLQRELAAIKRSPQEAGAGDRMENAELRERINDVAAEVARLTATLEGPDSPIDAILSGDAGRPAPAPGRTKGNGTRSAAPGGETKGTLADRIRALQGRAARVSRRQRGA
jgi:chromosome segregation ATPase